jgi:hypothetical protein
MWNWQNQTWNQQMTTLTHLGKNLKLQLNEMTKPVNGKT